MSRLSFSCCGSRVLSWLMVCLLAFATSNTPASAQMACPQALHPEVLNACRREEHNKVNLPFLSPDGDSPGGLSR